MTLKFFGRKGSTTKGAADGAKATPKPEPAASRSAARPATRRRPAAKPASDMTSSTRAPERTSATNPLGDDVGPKPRTRRGRRGGARRSKATSSSIPVDAAAPIAPAPTTATPGRTPTGAVDGAATDAQIAAFTAMQGSLSAIERRLGAIDRLSSTAERPRIGIFVDVPNIMYAAERERVALDFEKVLKFLVRDRELVRASAYAPISDDAQLKLEGQKFVQPFVDLGYRIVTKPWKRFADGSIKANFDVELAIDVLTMSDRLDIVVLLSGDGDFRRLIELVESKGVRVEVVAFGQSTASELRAVADEYIDLGDHLAALRT